MAQATPDIAQKATPLNDQNDKANCNAVSWVTDLVLIFMQTLASLADKDTPFCQRLAICTGFMLVARSTG
jgi:hypothetical protein